jgi:alginate O-acetyltransferase complex protein AlgI
MLFHSVQYLFFVPVIFALYWLVADHPGPRKWLLLLASATFYCAWNPLPFLLVLYCSTFDYFAARLMERAKSPKQRKALVIASLVSNLSVLGFFKYANFLLETFATMIGWVSEPGREAFLRFTATVAGVVGIDVVDARFDILLPIGLSFVVFQTLSYTIDVYRNECKVRHSWVDVTLFISFFPQIIAGPIVRAADFLPQLDVRPQITGEQGAHGLLRVAKGLVKKLLIADLLAANIVDRVFASPQLYSPIEVWTATFGYTLQIYYDFSAYSDIAIGTAALFGFKIRENFDRPYKATSLPDFWRRWHISLSTWLRDYLYIPLGGNRGGRLLTVRNVMITMILGGIWHGADWRMALWGLVHGIGLSMTRLFWWTFGTPDPKTVPWWRKASMWTVTFIVVMLARIFFRAPTFGHAVDVFKGLWGSGLEAPNVTPTVLTVLAIASAIHFGPSNLYQRFADVVVRMPVPVRAAVLVGIALVVKHVANFDVQPFFYFQF